MKNDLTGQKYNSHESLIGVKKIWDVWDTKVEPHTQSAILVGQLWAFSQTV